MIPDSASFQPCEGCALAKSTRQIYRVSYRWATNPFQKIYLDTVGPLTMDGLGNYHYYLILSDDFSRCCWISTLVNKGQGFSVIELFFAMVRTQFSFPIAALHCDNSNEYGGGHLRDFLALHGCLLLNSAPYHHEQNDIVE